ncbi:MAG: TetR/AcrR family transcriptional regulator, partial [Pseudomonas sp.]
MRYSEDHKAHTHRRIIEEAAERFRRDGVGATGLQPLMKALGLTHGGFYAHFKSKDELVEEALRAAADKLKASSTELFAGADPLPSFIESYLSERHRANPGAGCPLPTMSAELGQRGQASPVTDEVVRDRLAAIEGALPGPDAADASVAMLATLVGALVLSRSVADPELSDRILATARRWLKQQASG